MSATDVYHLVFMSVYSAAEQEKIEYVKLLNLSFKDSMGSVDVLKQPTSSKIVFFLSTIIGLHLTIVFCADTDCFVDLQ